MSKLRDKILAHHTDRERPVMLYPIVTPYFAEKQWVIRCEKFMCQSVSIDDCLDALAQYLATNGEPPKYLIPIQKFDELPEMPLSEENNDQ